MSEQFNTDDLTIASGVVETILALAVSEVPGVAKIGAPSLTDSIFSNRRRQATQGQGILVLAEDNQIFVDAHIQVFYGFQLQNIAAGVRQAIAETLSGQIGVEVAAVDVYIDGVTFPE